MRIHVDAGPYPFFVESQEELRLLSRVIEMFETAGPVPEAWKQLAAVPQGSAAAAGLRLPGQGSRLRFWYRAGLRPGAPTWFCSKPDADNAAKAVMDALTVLGLWQDDAQVVSLVVRKTLGEGAGATVTVATI